MLNIRSRTVAEIVRRSQSYSRLLVVAENRQGEQDHDVLGREYPEAMAIELLRLAGRPHPLVIDLVGEVTSQRPVKIDLRSVASVFVVINEAHGGSVPEERDRSPHVVGFAQGRIAAYESPSVPNEEIDVTVGPAPGVSIEALREKGPFHIDDIHR
jgi:hypothetical protein